MSKIKYLSSKIPTIGQLYNKYGAIKTLILLMGIVVITLLLPYIFGFNYYAGFIFALLSYLGYIFIMLWVMREYKNSKNRYVWLFVFSIGIIIELIAAFNIIVAPTSANQASSKQEYQSTATYVTYSPTCEYCKKSAKETQRAVAVYNATHWNNVYLVNIDKNTKLTKKLKKKLEYKGTIIKDNTKVVYTKGNSRGPVKVSSAEIFDHINNVN